jgi:flagellar biosynthetic protein FliQ
MDPQVVIDMMQESFKVSLFLAMPPLLAGLVVGVLVSIFQSVTSIQEQTLVFVPKMIAVMITLIVAFSWMMSMIIQFTVRLFQSIPAAIR